MKNRITNNLIIIFGTANLAISFEEHWTKYVMMAIAIVFTIRLLINVNK